MIEGGIRSTAFIFAHNGLRLFYGGSRRLTLWDVELIPVDQALVSLR